MASGYDNFLDFCNELLLEIEQHLKKDPGNAKWQYELCKIQSRIAIFQFSLGTINAGSNSFLAAANILEQLVKSDPGNKIWQQELYRTYEMLGDFLYSYNDLHYAELFYSQAETIRKKVQGEDHPEYIMCLGYLASLHISMGKKSVAETLLKQQLAAYEKMPGNESTGYALCLDQLAGIYLEKGNQTESQLLFLKSVAFKKKLFGEKHHVYEASLQKLNELYKKAGSLNSVYGDMSKAMQGNAAGKNELKGNPALHSMDKMLWEADVLEEEKKKGNAIVQIRSGENVNFAVSFPGVMMAAESYIVDVWLFLEEQRNRLLERIKEESNEKLSLKSEGSVVIERGSVITAGLSIDGLTIEPPEKTLTWTGSLNNSSFMVTVPGNASEGSKIGRVCFYINGLEVARLHFKFLISIKLKEEFKPANSFTYASKYRTAFASYASDDRNEVLARVQGLEKAGVEVFMDVRNLRSGQRYEEILLEKIRDTDVFYLFWSKAAKKSEWVKKEWEYALNNRGIDVINPIPLESPDVVPPPPELSQVLHFGDWTLAYKRAKS